MEELTVVCPTCFESFSLPPIPPEEAPCEIDYDCEICCRPMVVSIEKWDGQLVATAAGLGD